MIFYSRVRFHGDVTLAHLVCALNSVAAQLMFKNTPQNGLWTTKDHQGYYDMNIGLSDKGICNYFSWAQIVFVA